MSWVLGVWCVGVQIRSMEDLVRNTQSYSGTLQSYNTSLQGDLTSEKAKREEVTRARDLLASEVAELRGGLRSLEQVHAVAQVRALRGQLCCPEAWRAGG